MFLLAAFREKVSAKGLTHDPRDGAIFLSCSLMQGLAQIARDPDWVLILSNPRASRHPTSPPITRITLM
jgi:hypothetical protein